MITMFCENYYKANMGFLEEEKSKFIKTFVPPYVCGWTEIISIDTPGDIADGYK